MYFFLRSRTVLIKLVMPQAAQLGFYFFNWINSNAAHHTYLLKDTLQRTEREKSPAPEGKGTHNVSVTRCVLYRCATTVSLPNLNWVTIVCNLVKLLNNLIYLSIKQLTGLRHWWQCGSSRDQKSTVRIYLSIENMKTNKKRPSLANT